MDATSLFFASRRPWYRGYSRRLMPWVGGLLIIQSLIFLTFHGYDGADIEFGLLAAGVYLLYRHFAIRRFVRRSHRSNPQYQHDFTADISEGGIHLVTATDDSLSKWGSFVRFLESDKLFVLFCSEFTFLIFPKRAFAAGEAEQFRELLKLNIPMPK